MNWQRSSRCHSANCCVEVLKTPNMVSVRNSQRPDEVIWFDPEEWSAFIAGAADGEFDIADTP